MKLNERDIAQAYVGKAYDNNRLLTVSYANGTDRYISDCYNFKKDQLGLFGITPTLLERWGYYGIEFTIYIYVAEGRIGGCKVSKYKNTYCGGHGRPSGYELHPTQQELRIFKRVMDYVTE